MLRRHFPLVCGLFGALAANGFAAENNVLRVHEWGTFTALLNERGEALPGINVDDEPVPAFCHHLNRWLLAQTHSASLVFMKGAPQRHPYVTLRLETPVIYFYPPQGAALPLAVDVGVQFRGGWLTEFYPNAIADAPGLKENSFEFGVLQPTTVGKLNWKNIQVGVAAEGPKTDSHVWLAPRKVQAVSLTVPPQTTKAEDQPESEKYLFYRGVGNRPVPLKITHDTTRNQLTLYSQAADALATGGSAKVPALWLAHVRADGTTAFRKIDPVTLTPNADKPLATVSSVFAPSDYSVNKLVELRDELHAALVKDGLFGDEATAMLNTWERAYFKSAGLRMFFLVPRVWTEHVLPLQISQAAQVERVMVGRIELISPEQRALLNKLSKIELSDPKWLNKIWESKDRQKFLEGRSDFSQLDIDIPDDYRSYLDLGRFRNALVLAENKVRRTKELTAFIGRYELTAFEPSIGAPR